MLIYFSSCYLSKYSTRHLKKLRIPEFLKIFSFYGIREIITFSTINFTCCRLPRSETYPASASSLILIHFSFLLRDAYRADIPLFRFRPLMRQDPQHFLSNQRAGIFTPKTLLRAGLPSPFISVQRPCTVNTGWKKSSARILGWFLPAFAEADPCVFAVTCAQPCRICLHLKIVTYLIALDRPSNFVKRSSNNTCGI